MEEHGVQVDMFQAWKGLDELFLFFFLRFRARNVLGASKREREQPGLCFTRVSFLIHLLLVGFPWATWLVSCSAKKRARC